MQKVGKWIEKNHGFLYGRKDAKQIIYHGSSNAVSYTHLKKGWLLPI